jgi:hypothetical protein
MAVKQWPKSAATMEVDTHNHYPMHIICIVVIICVNCRTNRHELNTHSTGARSDDEMPRLVFLALGIALTLVSGCGSGGGNLLTGPPLVNVFNGQYAFVLSGFDPAGSHPMAIVGSVTADGLGHITNEIVDVNDNQVVSFSNSAVPGSYTLDSNYRGIIALSGTFGSVTHPLAFAFTLNAGGISGDLIGFDANNFVLSGTIQKQDATAFLISKLAGDFAFGIDSRVPFQSSTVGRFTLGQTGISTNVQIYSSSAGVYSTGLQTGGPVSVTFAAEGPNGSGRGFLNLTNASNQTTTFVYYVVGADAIFIMEIDPIGAVQSIYAGTAIKQNTPFPSLTVNSPRSVFALSGYDSTSPNEISAIGLLQFTGCCSATLTWDTDYVGTIYNQVTQSFQAVAFDPSFGCGSFVVPGGSSEGLFDSAVFCLTDPGKGFLLDSSPRATNRALAGQLMLQIGSGSFGPATYSGKKLLREAGLTLSENGAADGLVSDSVSNNILTGTSVGDFKNLLGFSVLNQASSLIPENIAIDANTGRGTLTFPSQDNTYTNTNVFYLVGPHQYVLIDETPPPHNAIPIEFHDPQ